MVRLVRWAGTGVVRMARREACLVSGEPGRLERLQVAREGRLGAVEEAVEEAVERSERAGEQLPA